MFNKFQDLRVMTQPNIEDEKIDLLGYIPSNVSLYGSNNESEWSLSGITKEKHNDNQASQWSESIFLQPGHSQHSKLKVDNKGDSNFIQNQLLQHENFLTNPNVRQLISQSIDH